MGRMFGSKASPTQIKAPTLFIYGEKDNAVLTQTVSGVREMIDAPFTEHRIQASGHWVQQEARDEVTKVIRAFWAAP